MISSPLSDPFNCLPLEVLYRRRLSQEKWSSACFDRTRAAARSACPRSPMSSRWFGRREKLVKNKWLIYRGIVGSSCEFLWVPVSSCEFLQIPESLSASSLLEGRRCLLSTRHWPLEFENALQNVRIEHHHSQSSLALEIPLKLETETRTEARNWN